LYILLPIFCNLPVGLQLQDAVLSQRWPRDAPYI